MKSLYWGLGPTSDAAHLVKGFVLCDGDLILMADITLAGDPAAKSEKDVRITSKM